MKKKSSNNTIQLLLLVISSLTFLPSCDDEDEFDFIGNASIAGKLQYQDALSGSAKDVPKGTAFQVYFEGQTIPLYEGQTTQDGFWSYDPVAVGSYTIEVSRKDTLLQFLSELVRKEDLDTTRSMESIIIDYKASSTLSVSRDEQKQNDLLLLFEATGLRLAVKDENGQPIPRASLCLYGNETFYSANFPNCGGSLKYIETDENGIALFAGLQPNKSYFVNARARAGVLEIDNHDNVNSQTFNTGNLGLITDGEIILK